MYYIWFKIHLIYCIYLDLWYVSHIDVFTVAMASQHMKEECWNMKYLMNVSKCIPWITKNNILNNTTPNEYSAMG